MPSNVIFLGWNRQVPGREKISNDHFQEFLQYAAGLQQAGTIQSFQPVLLGAHGGDLNGFFLVTGEPAKLDALVSSEEWESHVMRGGYHLEGFGVVRGMTGDLLMQAMQRYVSMISG